MTKVIKWYLWRIESHQILLSLVSASTTFMLDRVNSKLLNIFMRAIFSMNSGKAEEASRNIWKCFMQLDRLVKVIKTLKFMLNTYCFTLNSFMKNIFYPLHYPGPYSVKIVKLSQIILKHDSNVINICERSDIRWILPFSLNEYNILCKKFKMRNV